MSGRGRRAPRAPAALLLATGLLVAAGPAAAAPPAVRFTDVTHAAGLAYEHGWRTPLVSEDGSFDERRHFAGGIAAGDYDDDGFVDLYAVRGDIGPNLLLRNRGDGTFVDEAAAAGVVLDGTAGCGPAFADLDGDGRLDLLVGGVRGEPLRLFRNTGARTFTEVTAGSGLDAVPDTYSAAFGDYDRDGDLDVLLAHWNTFRQLDESSRTLWRNDGGFRFTDVSLAAGVASRLVSPDFPFDFTFTPNFADLDGDGWPDVLLAADVGTSTVLRNRGDGTFADITDPAVITDENGMGAAIGDYDRDGILDWFVSSIWDPDGHAEGAWGVTGNRLYRGRGDGTFADVTETAGVRAGYWGWAATWSDVDNDGDLDLFHVNGYGRDADYEPSRAFFTDPSVLFLNDGSGRFSEQAVVLGLDDHGMGRGAVSFDYDRDGDLDLLIANAGAAPRLFRNDGGNARHFLVVHLRGAGANRHGIGARVTVRAGGVTQLHELRAGSNYASQDPSEVHVGLGAATVVDELHVRWPSGAGTRRTGVAADQWLVLHESPPPCAGDCNGDGTVFIDDLLRAVAIALGDRDLAACAAADRNDDAAITIDELVAALHNALGGCS